MTIGDFIKKRPYLVWYTKNYKNLSEGAVVEAVLQYGDWKDCQQLFSLLGINKVASIFRTQLARRRNNYNPKIANYFTLYFKRHARHARHAKISR